MIRVSRINFVVLEGRLCKMLGGAELTIEIVEAGHLFGDDLRLGVLISQRLGHGRESPAGSLVVVDDLRQCVRSLPVGVVQKQDLVPLPFSPCLVRAYDALQHVLRMSTEHVVSRVDCPQYGEEAWSRTTFLNTGSASVLSK